MRTFPFPSFPLYRWFCIALLVAGCSKSVSSQVLNALYAVPKEKRLDIGIRLLLDSVSSHDTTTSFRLLDEFIQFSSSKNDIQLKATAYAFKAIYLEYRIEKGYERSIPYFRRAVSLLENTGFELEKAYFTNRLGYALCSKHEYQEGLAFLLKSDYMMKHIGYERIMGVEYSLYRIARVYFDFEDYESAIRHLEEAFLHTQKEDLLHSMNNLMAISYAELKNTEKSLFYIQQALKAAINVNDTFGVASAITNIGMMYEEQEDYTKSRYFLDSAYALNVKHNYWRNAASALLGLAEVNIAEKK
jgi:tetratricopeptide (TPR) repeat protein